MTKQNKTRRSILLAIAALVIAAVTLCAVVFSMSTGQTKDPSSGVVLDKNAVEFDAGDTLSADPLRIRFPGYNDITLSQSDTDIPILLTNPTDNPCLFQFDVTLDESPDSLLHSDWVEPGKALESVTLPHALSPGDHTLHVAISTRSLDGTEPMNGGSVTVGLHVA